MLPHQLGVEALHRRLLLLSLLLPVSALAQEPAAAPPVVGRDWAALSRQERTAATRRLRGGQRAAEGPSAAEMATRWDALTPTQRTELMTPPRQRTPRQPRTHRTRQT